MMMGEKYREQRVPVLTLIPNKHPTETMQAVEWHGSEDVRMEPRPRPMVTDDHDAIIRVTSTTICGSDLHFYFGLVQGMEKGDVIGHECVGIVDSIGSDVHEFKVGDRVVVSAIISCGKCWYCKNGYSSCCDVTNPSKKMEEMYGHKISGVFGYSHLTGGYDGAQAEYIRVPFGDVNCLPVPDSLADDQVLFLSDILCTGWHANELGEVKEGDTVAVWGCGPVGLMSQALAKFRGASRVIGIDHIDYRLLAAKKLGSDVINFDEVDVFEEIQRLIPGGPDVVIEAAGFRFPKTLAHKFQRAVKLETDSLDILNEMIRSVRKAGHLSIVGDYFATGNGFAIGALMEKAITLRGGQNYAHKYWRTLLKYIEEGKFDPTFVITHHMSFDRAAEAYRMFANYEQNSLKIILRTQAYKAYGS
jgi:threonine dehydrogenase-like Zn-dependent dehydrogenase